MVAKPKFIEYTKTAKNYAKYALYECSCGNLFEARVSHINAGQKSCGCMRKSPPVNIKHGLCGSPAYISWSSMMDRCYKQSHPAYHRYGGRGIRVCEAWKNVETFCEWAVENGCQKGMQLDRIDNNSGYSPRNCRYVVASENAKNRSNTYWWHTPDGIFPTLKEASKHYGKWIASRFDRGDMPEYYKELKYEND